MGLVTRTFTFSAGGTIVAAQFNTNENTLYNLVNGTLDTTNLASNAAIVDTQLAQITTASKVSGAALTGTLIMGEGANIASATTTNIGTATGNTVHITGTTTITAFDTIAAGAWRNLIFDGILTLTHNATSLILPGAANITTAANDAAVMVSEGSGNWRCLVYQPASGLGLAAATQAQMEAASVNTAAVTPGTSKYHPGVSKAWCTFNGSTTGTNAPTSGYNVTSVTRNGTGDYTINLTVSFSSTSYCAMGCSTRADAGGMLIVGFQSTTPFSTGSFRVLTLNQAGAAADGNPVSVVAFGDQ